MDKAACDSLCQPLIIELPPLDGGTGVKSTRKGKKRRGKSDTTEQEQKVLCMPGCKKGRDQSDIVIQCHACQVWAHYECIDEYEADIVGIWTCNQCRKMPIMLTQLIDMVAGLRDSMSELRNANAQLVAMVVDQNSELQHLRDEIKQRQSKDTTSPPRTLT